MLCLKCMSLCVPCKWVVLKEVEKSDRFSTPEVTEDFKLSCASGNQEFSGRGASALKRWVIPPAPSADVFTMTVIRIGSYVVYTICFEGFRVNWDGYSERYSNPHVYSGLRIHLTASILPFLWAWRDSWQARLMTDININSCGKEKIKMCLVKTNLFFGNKSRIKITINININNSNVVL